MPVCYPGFYRRTFFRTFFFQKVLGSAKCVIFTTILKAIYEYIQSLRIHTYQSLPFQTPLPVAPPPLFSEKSCQTDNPVKIQRETQTEPCLNAQKYVQTESRNQENSGCQTEILANVTDSPSKHRPFNIHSLIADKPKTAEKSSPEKPTSGKAASSRKRIEHSDGSRSWVSCFNPKIF